MRQDCKMPYHWSELEDAKDREKALDCSKSIHCESPAGSGKTTLLTERFLKLLSKTDHPRQILALTFTNKAAGEMRQRIWDTLRDAEKDTGDLNDRRITVRNALERHNDKRSLLFSHDGLRIMTFHSLCHSIVRSAPLEAGVPSGISVIEGVEYEELLFKITDESFQKIAGMEDGDPRKSALERWLLRTNNNWPAVRSDLVNLMKKRDYLKDLIAIVSAYKDICSFQDAANKTLGSLIDMIMGKTWSAMLSTGLGKNWHAFLQTLGETAEGDFSSLMNDAKWAALPEWQRLADLLTTKKGEQRKRIPKEFYAKGGHGKNSLAEMIGILPDELCQMLNDLRALPVDGFNEDQIRSIYDLIICAGEVISKWQEVCRQRCIIDFVGLELACMRVFSNAAIPDIQYILDSRIDHILVDEFQDTSRNQWEILQKICAGWTIGDGRTLFIVGDPKQSIYAFRKADVSLFIEAKKGLPVPGQERLPLESVTLKNNFRSSPGLVDWTNRIFGETVMAHPRTDMDEVCFSPSTAYIKGGHDLSLNVFICTEKIEDPQLAEARWLSVFVKEMDQRIDKNMRIGILLFARTRITLFLEALNEAGISIKVTDGLLLSECIEVMYIHQMATALVRPHDDLAWASLIRSPWRWCSAEQLCEVWRQKDTAWMNKIASYVESRQGEWLKRWWESIRKARIRVGHEPLFKLVKDAWLEMDGAYMLSRRLGPNRVANILRYLELLEESEQYIPEETLAKLEQGLKWAYMPNPPDSSRSRIELMTVHKAKGLEFDYVFCPHTDWDPLAGGRTEQPPYLMETGHDGNAILAVRKDKRQEDDEPIYTLLRKREQGRRIAESKRLFYVAVTRAKKGLYLSGVAKTKDNKIFAKCKDSPLSYIIQHEGIGEWEIDEHDIGDYQRAGSEGMKIFINPHVPFNIYDHVPSHIPPYISANIPSNVPLHIPADECSTLSSFLSIPDLPEPFPFSPQKIPYKVISPSDKEFENETPINLQFSKGEENYLLYHSGQDLTPGFSSEMLMNLRFKNENENIQRGSSDETRKDLENVYPDHKNPFLEYDYRKTQMARGTVIHQILARISMGHPAPSERAVTSALYREGLDLKKAENLAGPILKEVGLCMKEPECAWVLSQDHAEAYTEWAIEDSCGKDCIRSGIIDRLIFDSSTWWIVDYKTVNKGAESLDMFLGQQAELYKKQMESYREMVSKWKGAAQDKIVMVLYFTALQKSYRYPQSIPHEKN
ncbi:UvrD-helicase domain-containing protein [bacterium]|nr:UvrD-helicase domain-containing protein [bacterium]